MLDRFLLSFARYHYSFCKHMALITQSPYWYAERSSAALDISEIDG